MIALGRLDRAPRPSGSATCSCDRALGGRAVERHRAADQLLAEAAEHEVRVRVRRPVVAAAVAGRARVRARRLRPVPQRARLVDPRERAAAGADRQHLDRREADRVAVLDEPLLRYPLLAVVDERDVRRGPAHVEADRVRVAAQRGDVAARDRAGGDPEAASRTANRSRELRGHHAAARVEQQHVAAVAAARRAGRCSRLDVARDERRQDGVGDRGREALVLEDLRQHLGRGRDGHPRQLLLQDLAHPQLVRRGSHAR